MPVIAVVGASSAYAATNTICVDPLVVTCEATIQDAITAAASDGVDSVINIPPGTYTDGPYNFEAPAGQTLTVNGSGASTIFTFTSDPGAQTFVTVNGSTLTGVAVQMPASSPGDSSDRGISAGNDSVLDSVIVDGSVANEGTGIMAADSEIVGSAVSMITSGSTQGISSNGDNDISETTIEATVAFAASSNTPADQLSRLTMSGSLGVWVSNGAVHIENSTIEVSTGGTGLRLANFNSGTQPATLTADHLTVVGSGGSGSLGVLAYAATPTAKQTVSATVTNSIVRGFETSFQAQASNNGSQGGASSANISAGHTAYENVGTVIDSTTGSGGVTFTGGMLTADPMLPGGGDLHPPIGSPVIDAGDPVAGGGTLDLDGNDREQDGNGDDVDRRDMGAYELIDTTAPVTAITAGPPATSNDVTPTFTFGAGKDLTFTCQVDGGAEVACTSPFTTAALSNGSHTVKVRATDTQGNADASPASFAFVVDTVKPTTKLVRKPGKVVSAPKAKFTFATNENGATFQCRLDKKPFKKCLSPTKLKVKPGKHTFYVRAVDSAGNVDATPAKYKFTKVKPPKD